MDPRTTTNMIVLHHTATPTNTTVESIRNYHISIGDDDIAYHYLIDVHGNVHIGRPAQYVGAHCYGHNHTSIGIALIGNFDIEPPPHAMMEACTVLIRDLCSTWGITRLLGHRELFDGTVCPGKYVDMDVLRGNELGV